MTPTSFQPLLHVCSAFMHLDMFGLIDQKVETLPTSKHLITVAFKLRPKIGIHLGDNVLNKLNYQLPSELGS